MFELKRIASSEYVNVYRIILDEEAIKKGILLFVVREREFEAVGINRSYHNLFFVDGLIYFDQGSLTSCSNELIASSDKPVGPVDIKSTIEKNLGEGAFIKDYHYQLLIEDDRVEMNIYSSCINDPKDDKEERRLQEWISKAFIQDFLLAVHGYNFAIQIRAQYQSFIGDIAWSYLKEQDYYFDIYGNLVDMLEKRDFAQAPKLFTPLIEEMLV